MEKFSWFLIFLLTIVLIVTHSIALGKKEEMKKIPNCYEILMRKSPRISLVF